MQGQPENNKQRNHDISPLECFGRKGLQAFSDAEKRNRHAKKVLFREKHFGYKVAGATVLMLITLTATSYFYSNREKDNTVENHARSIPDPARSQKSSAMEEVRTYLKTPAEEPITPGVAEEYQSSPISALTPLPGSLPATSARSKKPKTDPFLIKNENYQVKPYEIPGATEARFENKSARDQARRPVSSSDTVSYSQWLERLKQLYLNNDMMAVESHCRLLLKSRPEDANAVFYLGVSLWEQGMFDQAETYLLKLTGDAVFGRISCKRLSEIYVRKGQHELARYYAGRAAPGDEEL